MNKIALAVGLGLLMFFTYLTAIRPAYAFAYALCLLGLVAWVWPRLAIRGITLARKLDPGSPTVGETYEETIEVRRSGWVPAPWVEVRDLGRQRGGELEDAGGLSAPRMDVLWAYVGQRARAVRPLQPGAEDGEPHVGPGLSTRATNPRSHDSERSADRQLTEPWSLGRVSARHRRCARLHAW